MESKFNAYIGIPYKNYGRNINGCDCYGLTWLIQKEIYGKILPSFSCYGDDIKNFFSSEKEYISNERISNPKEGDIIAIYMYNSAHLGVMINSKKFIHSGFREGNFSTIDRVDNPLYYKRIEGFYRV